MILTLVKKFRRRKLIVFLINLSLLLTGIFLFLFYLQVNIKTVSSLISILALVSVYLFIRSAQYQSINTKNLLEHLNRNSSGYQESAQLLRMDIESLPPIQQLQQKKVLQLFEDDYALGKLNQFLPKLKLWIPTSLLIINLLLLSFGTQLASIILQFNLPSNDINKTSSPLQELDRKDWLADITNSKIVITPPSYTGVGSYSIDSLEFNAIEGSRINWSLDFSQPQQKYYIWLTGQDAQEMSQDSKQFIFEHQLKQTTLYRFSQQMKPLDGIYAITMDRDKPPKIKITQPNVSLVEIAKTEAPIFSLETIISDDFAITDIQIIASVAKGSGEAVKFRDRSFKFSPSERVEQKNSDPQQSEKIHHYKKNWSLTDLEMEPGDEVYFSLLATDNKQPTQQTTKSHTIIVKWLDDELVETAAEGLRIHFQPEYFRSQRQIIIETEQLIADQKDLSLNNFQNTSRDLGHSQNDLREKYGQYLGDEFGEGPAEQHGMADGYHGGESLSSGEATAGMETDNEHAGEEDHHKEQEPHEEHSTIDDLSNTANNSDPSGASELIQEFTHNHGSVEIGPLSQRDPKSWMKMAVNEMWQSELYLMLSNPEKALPYAYKAYDYLKQARQAERIYAKRLGFEPPPVSEDRRLTGELNGILQYKRNRIDTKEQDTDIALYQSIYQLLNQMNIEQSLLKQQVAQFSRLSSRFLELSESRPALVKYATISEKISQAGSLNITQCDQCTSQLKAKLWQLLPQGLGLPKRANKYHGLSTDIEKNYLNQLKEIEGLNE